MTCNTGLVITPGKTFDYAWRWAEPRLAYKTITAATRAAPCVLTVPGHGLTDGWPFRIESVTVPLELNSPKEDETACYIPTVLDPDTLELESLNTLELKAFSGSGAIVYFKPADLTGLKGRINFLRSAGAEPVTTLTSDDGAITVEVETATVGLFLGALVTKTLGIRQGFYEVEVFDPANPELVFLVAHGSVTVGA